MIDRQQAQKILGILRETLVLPAWMKRKRSAFETLVVTIISQNTADTNTARAYENLQSHFEITPQALATADLNQIEAAIKSAGLYKAKAQAIKQASQELLQNHGGTLQNILAMPTQQARETLMQFPGVGPKTADVVLLFSANQPTVPVDTHVNRVSRRLGLAPAKGDYEAVRCSLQELYDPKDYLAVHMLLIEHGRKTCKARHPRCSECVVGTYCLTRGQWK
ncbi:MAG: endonuclease III [Candidatus Bathyarchaeota archaeon]|nr:endonuclease III [Candidatus Bathyarchaeota archaeon]